MRNWDDDKQMLISAVAAVLTLALLVWRVVHASLSNPVK
jgi:hypothetical protein